MDELKYSFIVPIYNDGYLATDFCIAFEKVFLVRAAVSATQQLFRLASPPTGIVVAIELHRIRIGVTR